MNDVGRILHADYLNLRIVFQRDLEWAVVRPVQNEAETYWNGAIDSLVMIERYYRLSCGTDRYSMKHASMGQ